MLIEKFEEQVKKFPAKIAVKVEQDEWTYERLNTCANQVAEEIQRMTLPKDRPQVGILLEHGAGMILSLLGALKAAMVYVPMDISYPARRLLYMVDNSEASLVITNNRNLELAERLAEDAQGDVAVLNIDTIEHLGNKNLPNPQRDINPDTPAYILYTSGSTGLPKGVIQNHGNVWYYTRNWIRIFEITPGTRMTLLTAFSHDGAVQDIFSALLGGAVLYPYDIKNAVNRTPLIDYLKQEKINIWHSVPTLFRYFASNLTSEDKFPDLNYILLGGEPLRKRDLELLKIRFPHAVMANVYGQTESSVACINRMTATDSFDKPMLGQPLDETELFLVDEEDEIVEDLGSGEIVVACNHIAPGYWKDEENTEAVFTEDPDMGRLYWTGDLGALNSSGQIEMMGRKDFQVKIRGFRVEVGEIETALLRHETIEETVVVVKTKEGDEPFLCAYVVFNDTPDLDKLRDYLMDEVPDYMVPSYFMPLDKLPVTPNGKIDRKLLPEPALHGMGTEYIAPRDDVEKTLAAIWGDILGIDKESIGINADFFELGGQSLKAVTVSLRIHKELHVKLQLPVLFSHTTIRKLGKYINAASAETFVSIEPAKEAPFYPLSSAQNRMYILQQMVPGSTHYNLPVVVRLEGILDVERVENAFRQMVARHESLRTSFRLEEGKPVQEIHQPQDVDFDFQYHQPEKGDTDEIDTIVATFVRAFDLSQPCQFRVALIREEADRHVLLADMHHIISDGTSMTIMTREFMALYTGETLPPLRLQYKDFSQWQHLEEQKKALEKQETFWLETFSGDIPVLDLPYDFLRPAVQSFAGSRWVFELGMEESDALKALVRNNGSTLFMVLLAMYNIFLYRLSGQEDIVIGTPVAGRNHDDLQPIIGMFVNTLALRNQPNGNQTVDRFMALTKEKTIEAFNNRDYPFEELVERVRTEKDLSRSPLFDTMFALRNYEAMGTDIPEVEIEGLRLAPYRYDNPVTHFDLTLYADDGGAKIFLTLEYCRDLFEEETIHRFGAYFKTMVASIIDNPREPLSRLEILTEEEKERILTDFNRTTADLPEGTTIHRLFEQQARLHPGNIAATGLSVAINENKAHGGESSDGNYYELTYRQLNEKADSLARLLREKGVGRETVAAVLVERSLEMIIGILAVLKAGGAYIPIPLEYPPERVAYILEDSNTNLLLTQAKTSHIPAVAAFENKVLMDREEIFTGESITTESGNKSDVRLEVQSEIQAKIQSEVTAEDLAYIIYTSGTTGRPKGTMVQHRSLVNLCTWHNRYYEVTETDNATQYAGFGFDASVWEVFPYLVAGAAVHVVADDIKLDIEGLANFYRQQNISIAFLPTQICRQFMEDAGDIPSLRILLAGGDKLNRFVKRKFRLYNNYGPTENTVVATYFLVDHPVDNIPIGKPVSNVQAFILHRDTLALQPLGIAGELCLGGDSLARGYLNNPELTAEKFYKTNDSDPSFLPPVIYKTGDLARWLPDGNIQFLGRIDHQVKVRGFRIELAEIEHLLLSHKSIKEAVVIERKSGDNDNYLCAYLCSVGGDAEPVEHSTIKEYLANKLPDYMIPAYFVTMDTIPLTPSGKVDRRALPQPEIKTDKYTAPRDTVEEQLAETWTWVLNLDSPVGIDDDFFHLGGHSLKATMLSTAIHKTFNVRVPLAEVFKRSTIRSQAAFIKESGHEMHQTLEPVEKREYYPLSSAQKRMFILQQIDPGALHYNIPFAVEIEGPLDISQLEESFRQVVARHESFRTCFELLDGVPYQFVRPAEDVDFFIEQIETENETGFVRTFDLTHPPLLRVGITEKAENRHLLMMDLHHIIADGVSAGILINEVTAFFNRKTLPPLRLQYKDFAFWQTSEKQVIHIKKQEKWWLEQFSDERPQLNLPLDYPRPPVQDFSGGRFDFALDKDTSDGIRRLMVRQGLSFYMVMSALFTLLLSKLSRSEDIIVGTAAAGRIHSDLEPIIGMFVNTLAMRNFPTGSKSFNGYVQEVKKRALAAFDNQQYPFEDLVEQVGVARDAGRNPLFDAMLTIQNIDRPRVEEGPVGEALIIKPHSMETNISKFDITLDAAEYGNRMYLTFGYATALFSAQSIETFALYFQRLARQVADESSALISSFQLASEEDMKRILRDFNDTRTDYPADKAVYQIFEDAALRTPQKTAVVPDAIIHLADSKSEPLSYKLLNEASERLAFRLRQEGVGLGSIVAITAESTPEMIVGIIGILKSGAAYLPIDPNYPEERKKYILADSAAPVLLTDPHRVKDSDYGPGLTVLPLDAGEAEIDADFVTPYDWTGAGPDDLAYIMYTSGSTGHPKGVMVKHRNVVRLVKNTCFVDLLPGDRILQTGALSFDASTFEIWGALLNGLTLYLSGPGSRFGVRELKAAIDKNSITTLWLTAPLFNQLVDVNAELFQGVRNLLVGGDRLSPDHINRVRKKCPHLIIINGYGPTENVTFSTTHRIEKRYEHNIPIGAPISNSTAFIVDAYGNLLPVGVTGELWVGGDGVSRGYMNNPELTAERFVSLASFKQGHLGKSFAELFQKRPPGGPPEANIYKTGDLARWLPDGTIEFIGRVDHQVKIRGFRIELGEIQRHLLQHQRVNDAVVMAREKRSGEKYLCAYVSTPSTKPAVPGELRTYLKTLLPEYMVPDHFVCMDAFPVNSNGKVDLPALPDPLRTVGSPDARPTAATDNVQEEITAIWKEVLGIDHVGIDDNYFDLGGNSLNIIKVNHKLKNSFGIDIAVADMFRFPTVRTLAQHINPGPEVETDASADIKLPLPMRASGSGDIAIIGMAGRFPGARNIDQFWENLKNGVESISFFTDDELLEAGIDPKTLDNPRYVKANGILDDVDCFDAAFFGYIPGEVGVMDPQARVFHECVWEALENAGYDPFSYNGLIGLYTGASDHLNWEILTIVSGRSQEMGGFESSLLSNKDFLATRVSYKLNLRGPSVIVQSACSTSMIALDNAYRDLQAGRCHMALAGGVAVTILEKSGYLYREGMIHSPDGHCRAFDAAAKGTVRGNGVGVVVLKPLDRAIADGDHIEALLKSVAVNNDGIRKVGYTAPSVEGQAEVIRAAQAMAGVDPLSISYVETHGTATPLGDPVEVQALKLAFNTDKKQYCGIGSVKTNVGHLDAAAAVTGIIKTVLALKHKLIPPSLHFKSPNPAIDFEHSPFYVNDSLTPWQSTNGPLRAGVSSFGIGGTNGHAVLEEAPYIPETISEAAEEQPVRSRQLLVLSARNQGALDEASLNLAHYLETHPGINLADAAYTLQEGRRAFRMRKTMVCNSIEDAVESLSSNRAESTFSFTAPEKEPSVVFMFSGQGSQYVNMAKDLYKNEPLFRREMDRCFKIAEPLMSGEDLESIIYPKTEEVKTSGVGSAERINHTEIAQPLIFIIEYAVAKLLMEWGIRPRAMIGHSIGEYVAAHLAGVFTLEEALELVIHRGRLMQKMPEGDMLGISLPEKDVLPLMEDGLSLAAVNSPGHSVVSGPGPDIARFAEKLESKNIRCRILHTSHAFHSHMMDPILGDFEAVVSRTGRKLKSFDIPFVSNVTGKWITVAEARDPRYWVDHLRGTVRFADGLKEIAEVMDPLLVEVGPGRTLATFAKGLDEDRKGRPPIYAVNVIRHPNENQADQEYLLSKLGMMWLYGVLPDWRAFHAPHQRKRISLPTYPFERQQYPVAGDPFKMVMERMAVDVDVHGGLYLPYWKPTPLERRKDENNPATAFLVFHHEADLGMQLVQQLREAGHQVISVTPAESFKKNTDESFCIHPASLDDYLELMNAVASLHVIPYRVLHFWSLPQDSDDTDRVGESTFNDAIIEEQLHQGFYSLIYLARAISKGSFKEIFQILHIGGCMQSVTGEEIVEPVKAMSLAPLKVIPQEFPNIRCRSIDIRISSGERSQRQIITQLIKEIFVDFADTDTLVALRGNQRWTRHFDPLELEPLKKTLSLSLLKENGVYLVTGGMGKIGLGIASFLAQHYKAHLILTGRTPLPPREKWQQLIDNAPAKDPQAEKLAAKLRKIRDLEQIAGGLLTHVADVADLTQMRQVVDDAEEQWGPIDGVIHAAGIVDQKHFTQIRDTEPKHCRIQFQPKVNGLIVLEQIFAEKPLDFCWAMSSVSTVLGGLGFTAYTAANIFMDAFVYRHNRLYNDNWISVDWDGEWYDDTPVLFSHILSLDGAQQVVFSLGSSLRHRIDRWIKLHIVEDDVVETGESGTGKQQTFGIDRPPLLTPYVEPQTPEQTTLARIWQNYFKFNRIGIDDDFFELGGDSLKAVTVIAIIHKEFNKEIPVSEFFSRASVRGLAEYLGGISDDQGGGYVSMEPVEKKEYYPLSSAQKRLYVLQLMEEGNIGYNMPNVAFLDGELEKEKLENVFRELIRRHEAFRTSFHMVNEEPVQIVHEPNAVHFAIEYHTMSDGEKGEGNIGNNSNGNNSNGDRGNDGDSVKKGGNQNGLDEISKRVRAFVRPFDLSQGPLLRIGLIRRSDQEHVVMMDLHHIITDGVSHGIFFNELMASYHGDPLPELRFQYKDFAVWQQSEAQRERIMRQQEFWVGEFEGEIPVLTLPTDFPRPPVQVFEGSADAAGLDKGILKRLMQLAQENDATLYMVMLSIYTLFLSKLSGQEDIVVGTPTAGREHADLQNIMGMFVNTLALRNRPEGEKPFIDFLKDIRKRTLQAFENRELLFEDLVELVNVKRDTARNPLFDVMFSFQNLDIPEVRMTGLKLRPFPFRSEISKFDMLFGCIEKEDGMILTLEYCTRLFKSVTIKRFLLYFKTLVTAVLAHPERPIKDITIIPQKERETILREFNDTEAEFPRNVTIHDYFRSRVSNNPGHTAVTGGSLLTAVEESLTYREFDGRSDDIACLLKEKGITPGDIVALAADRSVEMMIAIFGILKAGGVYLPVSPQYPEDRIRYILSDSRAKIMISTSGLPVSIKGNIDIIYLDRPVPEAASSSAVVVSVDDPAYVIYTSGSTGKPKGVMVEHRPVINRLNWMQRAYPIDDRDTLLQKTPIVFDVSVWELFWWSFQGASLYVLGPGDEKIPEALVSSIHEQRVTTIHFVPSMLNAFLEYLEEGIEPAHLSSLRQVFASGEALGTRQVVRFNKLLYQTNRTRLINLYGPTEATVDVSFYNCDLPTDAIPEPIPIGKPIDNIRLVILDKYHNLQPIGIAGELCIGGVGLARGYLNRPKLTAEKFIDVPPDLVETVGESANELTFEKKRRRLYRTGDLTRWLADGNIEFLGRLDFQVKIRGLRIELGEIESKLASHKGIKEVVVVAGIDNAGDSFICAYFVPIEGFRNSPDSTEILRRYLAKSLPDYMIPAYFVELEEIPLTPNGKVNRKALPEPQIIRTDRYEAARTPSEKALVEIWSDILSVDKENIGIDDGFFELGGHSLRATVMISRIHKALQVKVRLTEIFKYPTIRQLASVIDGMGREAFISIKPAPEKPYYSVSPAQRRLFIVQQMDPRNLDYNMNWMFIVEGDLQINKLEKAFQRTIQRHDVLRTGIRMEGIAPVQVIYDDVSFQLEYMDSETELGGMIPADEKMIGMARAFVRPFDLSQPPLLRARLIRVKEATYILIMDMHHIITDGISNQLIISNVVAFYNGIDLPPQRLQYKDFSEWQNQLIRDGEMKNQEEYWLKQFEGEIPQLQLPYDFPWPEKFKAAASHVEFEIEREMTSQLKGLILETGSTTFMILLAVFDILLARYCGQYDIVVGSAVLGRRHADLETMVGMFVNMLAYRVRFTEDLTFRSFLMHVKDICMGAVDNQDFQFDDLVSRLGIETEVGRTPLFDVQFNLNTVKEAEKNQEPMEGQGVVFRHFEYGHETLPFHLGLFATDGGESINMKLAYLVALFEHATIEDMTKHFNEILAQCLANTDIKLEDIEISLSLAAGEAKINEEDVSDGWDF